VFGPVGSAGFPGVACAGTQTCGEQTPLPKLDCKRSFDHTFKGVGEWAIV
jgi:hypothetical protein